MREMIKRRKDAGFTLIELMIVIAVIGILAVVLVPKMGGIKDSAKSAGVITNAKSVEAYTIANINKWLNNDDTTAEAIGYITTNFSGSAADALNNPYTGGDGIDDTAAQGVVVVTAVDSEDIYKGLKITGYGESGDEDDIVYENTITP